MLPWRDAVTEEIEVPAWQLRGARPQYDASLSWLDSSCLICFVNWNTKIWLIEKAKSG